MGPLWSQRLEGISVSTGGLRCDCGRKDLKQLLSVYDSMGKTAVTGRLPEDVDEIVLVDLYLLSSDVGPLWSQGFEGISVSIGGLRCDCGRKD